MPGWGRGQPSVTHISVPGRLQHSKLCCGSSAESLLQGQLPGCLLPNSLAHRDNARANALWGHSLSQRRRFLTFQTLSLWFRREFFIFRVLENKTNKTQRDILHVCYLVKSEMLLKWKKREADVLILFSWEKLLHLLFLNSFKNYLCSSCLESDCSYLAFNGCSFFLKSLSTVCRINSLWSWPLQSVHIRIKKHCSFVSEWLWVVLIS